MTKLTVRTDDAAGFFARAREAARRADRGDGFDEMITLSFEDPTQMFAVLSEGRRRLLLEIMQAPKTIGELSERLHRNRSAITKDVQLLEKNGLLVTERQVNPGHGIQKLVKSIAPKIEVVATLG